MPNATTEAAMSEAKQDRYARKRQKTCRSCGKHYEHGETYVLVSKKNAITMCHKCYLADGMTQQYKKKGERP